MSKKKKYTKNKGKQKGSKKLNTKKRYNAYTYAWIGNVSFSFLPILVVLLIDVLAGYPVLSLSYIGDFLAVSFSVCISYYSVVNKPGNTVKSKYRDIGKYVSFFICFLVGVIYFVYYYGFVKENNDGYNNITWRIGLAIGLVFIFDVVAMYQGYKIEQTDNE